MQSPAERLWTGARTSCARWLGCCGSLPKRCQSPQASRPGRTPPVSRALIVRARGSAEVRWRLLRMVRGCLQHRTRHQHAFVRECGRTAAGVMGNNNSDNESNDPGIPSITQRPRPGGRGRYCCGPCGCTWPRLSWPHVQLSSITQLKLARGPGTNDIDTAPVNKSARLDWRKLKNPRHSCKNEFTCMHNPHCSPTLTAQSRTPLLHADHALIVSPSAAGRRFPGRAPSASFSDTLLADDARALHPSQRTCADIIPGSAAPET